MTLWGKTTPDFTLHLVKNNIDIEPIHIPDKLHPIHNFPFLAVGTSTYSPGQTLASVAFNSCIPPSRSLSQVMPRCHNETADLARP